MKIKILLILSVLLVGCAEKQVVEIPEPKLDPIYPSKVAPLNVEWKLIDIDNKPHLALSFEDSQKLRGFGEDTKRYIKGLHSMLCFYREHLNESECRIRDK